MICIRTSEGVAPRALRTPNSLVRSFTEINKMFPIPITPAMIVAIPTISDKKVIPLANPMIRLNTSPRLKEPKALSSLGLTLWMRFKVCLTSFSTWITSASS